jgi:hypothetical protein
MSLIQWHLQLFALPITDHGQISYFAWLGSAERGLEVLREPWPTAGPTGRGPIAATLHSCPSLRSGVGVLLLISVGFPFFSRHAGPLMDLTRNQPAGIQYEGHPAASFSTDIAIARSKVTTSSSPTFSCLRFLGFLALTVSTVPSGAFTVTVPFVSSIAVTETTTLAFASATAPGTLPGFAVAIPPFNEKLGAVSSGFFLRIVTTS